MQKMSFNPGSRSKLTRRDLERFPSDTLFDKIARVVCEAECLPRKELFEAWEVARRTRRRFRGGRVLDLACGHALLAHLLLVLDDSSQMAVAVDTRLPSSALRVQAAFTRAWPRLEGRLELREASLTDTASGPDDLVVSCHACGSLTDRVIDKAIGASSRVVVLPCCHQQLASEGGGFAGWLDSSLSIDVTRVVRLEASGFRVNTQLIPAAITPKNRLLLAAPARHLDAPGSPIAKAQIG
jgi:hypothetical protein